MCENSFPGVHDRIGNGQHSTKKTKTLKPYFSVKKMCEKQGFKVWDKPLETIRVAKSQKEFWIPEH